MRKWVRLITHQTRLEGNKGGRFIIFHMASLGGITGQVKVLNKNCVGTFKDLQFYGTGGGHRHVRFFGKARHIVSQYYLLVHHFLSKTRHCYTLSPSECAKLHVQV